MFTITRTYFQPSFLRNGRLCTLLPNSLSRVPSLPLMNVIRRDTRLFGTEIPRKRLTLAPLFPDIPENLIFKHPVGEKRNLRLDNSASPDMFIEFLGTASCMPSTSRGVSCVALRHGQDTFLFDCGESAQLQIQKSRVKIGTVKKIFISHLHGDHFFGISGVLCFLGSYDRNAEENMIQNHQKVENHIVDIYGPEGLRDYIRSTLQLTYSKIAVSHRIHEIKNISSVLKREEREKGIKGGYCPSSSSSSSSSGFNSPVKTRANSMYGELYLEGRDIYPNPDGTYTLCDETEYTVSAAPLHHTVPCLGFVYHEKDKPGMLKVNKTLANLISSQGDEIALKHPEFLGDYRRIYRLLKEMKPDETFTMPNGTILKGEDVVEPMKPGRKIVILGDTSNSEYIEKLAINPDILIHEATNSFFPENDTMKYGTYERLERSTRERGHSTPQMAGKFAKKINAKQLLLTHFSQRYSGEADEFAMKSMWKIEAMARSEALHLPNANDIIAAWDFLVVNVPGVRRKLESAPTQSRKKTKNKPSEAEASTKKNNK
jgi:ribonuclease Z